jgi:hypothetical protein
MPTQQRRRCHHEAVPALLRKQTSKRSEKRTIGGPKPRRLIRARQDRELVPQSTSSTSLVNSARRLRTSSFKQQRRQDRRNRAASTDTPRPSDRSHRLAVLAPFSGSWYSHARVASKSDDGPNRDREQRRTSQICGELTTQPDPFGIWIRVLTPFTGCHPRDQDYFACSAVLREASLGIWLITRSAVSEPAARGTCGPATKVGVVAVERAVRRGAPARL